MYFVVRATRVPQTVGGSPYLVRDFESLFKSVRQQHGAAIQISFTRLIYSSTANDFLEIFDIMTIDIRELWMRQKVCQAPTDLLSSTFSPIIFNGFILNSSFIKVHIQKF